MLKHLSALKAQLKVVHYIRYYFLLPMASFIAGFGSDPPDAVLSGILHALQSMRHEQQSFQLSVNVRLSMIERHVGSRECDQHPAQAVVAPSQAQSRSRSCSRRRDDTGQGLEWICPICGEHLSHRESFKGHVRLCALSQHQRCRLMEDNVEHQALLSRFLDGDWNDRSKAFTAEFYDQIRVCSSSLDPVIKSHEHIFGWLKAATSQDASVMLPSYSRARAESKRRRSDGVARNAAGTDGLSSNGSSPGFEAPGEQLPFLRRD